MKEIVFHQKLLEKAYFIFKITDAAMVRPASSDFWKALNAADSKCLWMKIAGRLCDFNGTYFQP